MPKRRRLFTPNKHKIKGVVKNEINTESEVRDREVTSARGRFQGALKDVLDPAPHSEESEHSSDESPTKRDRNHSNDRREESSDEDVHRSSRKSPPRQSYVLKLFDRSVDLSQFRDDSPLYPICRAWMVNQPKANYKNICTNATYRSEYVAAGGVELPAAEGAPAPRAPPLLPEQAANKDNINLDYEEAPPPSREALLRLHMPRWAAVKQAWQDHITLKETRYEGTQRMLNKINQEYSTR